MPVDAALSRSLVRRLRRLVRGEVRVDPAAPVGIVQPADAIDVVAAVELCRELGVPIVPCGGGGLGGVASAGLVIDASRHLTAIGRIDRDASTVDVEPGVTLDRLDARLATQGLCLSGGFAEGLAADGATAGGAAGAAGQGKTIAALIGDNARGPSSFAHGDMVHALRHVEALLVDGTVQNFGPFGIASGSRAVALQSGRAARLVSALFELAARETTAIDRDWPRVGHAGGGYALDVFHPRSPRPYTADGSVNLAHLLAGSRGTLAWTQRATLAVARRPVHRRAAWVRFGHAVDAVRALRDLLALGPDRFEWIDPGMLRSIWLAGRQRPVLEASGLRADDLPREPSAGGAFWLVGWSGDESARLDIAMRDLAVRVAGRPGGLVRPIAGDDARTAAQRLAGGLWEGPPGAGPGECAVPLVRAVDGFEAVEAVLRERGFTPCWLGRMSAGTLHLRPRFASTSPSAPSSAAAPAMSPELARGLTLATRAAGGVHALLHCDRAAAARQVAAIHGSRLAGAFAAVKTLFDPDGLMNPPA